MIKEILGMDDIFFYENIGYLSVYVMLGLISIFGIKFILNGYKLEKNNAQREFFIGFGFFIISVALGEGIYLLDLVFRTYTESRLFLPLSSEGSEYSWQSIVGYPLASLIDRDYYIVVFTFILISLSFLMRPLEKFMLRRKRKIFTILNQILIPAPLLIRILEVNLYSITGIKVIEGSIPYYIFTGFWLFTFGVIVISVSVLIGIYLKMGITAPKGSILKRKSLMIVLGIVIWLITIFSTANLFRQISSGDWYIIPVIPSLLLLTLLLLSYGFKREY